MHRGRAREQAEARAVLGGWRPLIAAFVVLTSLATVTLYVFPDRTDRYFAWTIDPPLSAAFLGAGYAAGLVLVLLTARDRAWARARVALATVWVFTWLTLLVTLLHLDRFHFDADALAARLLAWLWLLVYLAVPPWMTVLLLKQRSIPGSDPAIVDPLPR